MPSRPVPGAILFLFIILACLLPAVPAHAASLEASVDRGQLREGESLVLTLTAPGNVDGNPDVTPLRQDFAVLGQSESRRFTVMNGRTENLRQWQLRLAPRRTGVLTVPSLELDGLRSPALTVQVLPAGSQLPGADAPPVQLEVEATPTDPRVQAQVVYTARLLSRRPVQEARLGEPSGNGLLVERLGDDRSYSVVRDGIAWQVVERRWALFPQASGSLVVSGPVLEAILAPENDPFAGMPAMHGFGSVFSGGERLSQKGRDITLTVAPPAVAQGDWLPAAGLTLSESWSPDPPVFRVGEPVTRTITLEALGLTAAQLPDPDLTLPDGLRAYQDQAESETRVEGDTLVGQRRFRLAIVPAEAGSFTLPELRLGWWDTGSGQQRVASLPARSIEVLPSAGQQAPATPAQPGAPGIVPTPDAAGAAQGRSTAGSAPVTDADTNDVAVVAGARTPEPGTAWTGWPWLALLLGTGWLGTVLGWLLLRRRPAVKAPSTRAAPPPDLAAARRAVEQACRAGDAAAARRALRHWADRRWPGGQGLETLIARLPTETARLLEDLDRSLYAPVGGRFDGAELWRQLAPCLEEEDSQAKGSPIPTLPELHPGGSAGRRG